jgi:hypothetical protein
MKIERALEGVLTDFPELRSRTSERASLSPRIVSAGS